MEYKKGNRVELQDGNIVRGATIVEDGIDSQGRVRVRPDGIPLDMSVTTEVNDRVYVIKQ